MPQGSPLSPPAAGDPDRKRVLNVLAQRRYRQRKKEQRAKDQAAGSASLPLTPVSTHHQQPSSERQELGVSSRIASYAFESEPGPNCYDTSPATVVSGDVDVSFEAFVNSASFEGSMSFTDDFTPQIITDSPSNSQDIAIRTPSIAPDTAMDIPILKLLQSFADTARHIGCLDLLFAHDATILWKMPHRTFPNLPAHMQPTQAQLTIPHHPIFDILPWPSVRTKLIYAFSLPESSRPAIAGESDGLVKMAYDMEDEKDGFRLNGEGREATDWEVGELFFRNWWWALDQGVINSSNACRLRRGQTPLRLDAG